MKKITLAALRNYVKSVNNRLFSSDNKFNFFKRLSQQSSVFKIIQQPSSVLSLTFQRSFRCKETISESSILNFDRTRAQQSSQCFAIIKMSACSFNETQHPICFGYYLVKEQVRTPISSYSLTLINMISATSFVSVILYPPTLECITISFCLKIPQRPVYFQYN